MESRRALLLCASLLAWWWSSSAEGAASDAAAGPEALLPATGEGGVTRLRPGETVALDGLGPLVVQEDCTVKRITNWDKMTERERDATTRRLSARNAERLGRCRELEEAGLLTEGQGREAGGASADEL